MKPVLGRIFFLLKPFANRHRNSATPTLHPMAKRKFPDNQRKCKVRINIRRFEQITLKSQEWGFEVFTHCLN